MFRHWGPKVAGLLAAAVVCTQVMWAQNTGVILSRARDLLDAMTSTTFRQGDLLAGSVRQVLGES